EVWVTYPGYTDSMKVYYNQDMASDSPWVNITYNLPNVPVHCGTWDVDGLFVGTDIGAFFLPVGEEEWIYYSKGLPTAAVTEIQIRNTVVGKLIFASTFGRGIWWSTPPAPERQTRWYVDSSAVGLNNGANWTNAFTDFQTALDTILPGDSIWVAMGTYFPGSTGFHLAYDNVYIWGGFDGAEDTLEQRDFINNPTILSGDIGVPNVTTDNSKHVFMFGGHNGNVLLDGFHVTKGNANGTGDDGHGGGIFYANGSLNGKPIISNCQVHHNTCVGYGAGMYIADYATGDPEMHLIKCWFDDNTSSDRGGGLYIDAYKNSFPPVSGVAVVYLDTCTITDNSAFAEGGGIYLEGKQNSTVRLYLDEVFFEDNVLTYFAGDGAALYCAATNAGNIELLCSNSSFGHHSTNSGADGGAIKIDSEGGTTESSFINCDFVMCDAFQGGAVFNYCPGASSTSVISFDDCLFLNNSAAFDGGAVYLWTHEQGNTEANFYNCTFINNSSTSRAGAIYYDADNGGHFVSMIDSCSFTENTASENGAIRFYVRNLTTNFNTPGTASLTMANSFFGDNNATGSTSGAAIGFISQYGTIDASISETDFMQNSAGAKGGAIIHIHNPSDSSDVTVSYTNCNFTDNTVPFSGGSGGGALAFDKTNATMSGCVFTENSGKDGGAVFFTANAENSSYSQIFNDCQFIKNKGANNGGALYILHDNPALTLVNINTCVFDSNYTTNDAQGRGGAIYTTGLGRSIQTISNTSFIDNIAAVDAGAIYITNSLSATDTLFVEVDSCTFENNDAAVTGETIEQFGNGTSARIYTYWSNSSFYNEESSVMFRIGKNEGVSQAIFHDCYLYLLPESDSDQALQPVMTQMLPIQVLTEDD
ncbi:MAG TPA: hypothetical protein VI603_19115, partial [Saprospiraceae bacterium]|nr:hypothetical protein [Saprospiraceae bacterium]